jgi:hypothetical protein
MKDFIEWVMGSLFVLIVGSYSYTFKSTQRVASKQQVEDLKEKVCQDVDDLRDRLNMIVQHLLNKDPDEALRSSKEKKNGKATS